MHQQIPWFMYVYVCLCTDMCNIPFLSSQLMDGFICFTLLHRWWPKNSQDFSVPNWGDWQRSLDDANACLALLPEHAKCLGCLFCHRQMGEKDEKGITLLFLQWHVGNIWENKPHLYCLNIQRTLEFSRLLHGPKSRNRATAWRQNPGP